jgi:hypothetical protein
MNRCKIHSEDQKNEEGKIQRKCAEGMAVALLDIRFCTWRKMEAEEMRKKVKTTQLVRAFDPIERQAIVWLNIAAGKQTSGVKTEEERNTKGTERTLEK